MPPQIFGLTCGLCTTWFASKNAWMAHNELCHESSACAMYDPQIAPIPALTQDDLSPVVQREVHVRADYKQWVLQDFLQKLAGAYRTAQEEYGLWPSQPNVAPYMGMARSTLQRALVHHKVQWKPFTESLHQNLHH